MGEIKTKEKEYTKHIKVSRDGDMYTSSKEVLKIPKVQKQIAAFAKVDISKMNRKKG